MTQGNDSTNGAIDPFLMELFIRETLLQCQFGLASYNAMIGSIRSDPPPTTFLRAHSFLTHAAMVSKILSPASTDVTKAEKQLLGEERVTDLQQIRKLRGGLIQRELQLDGDTILRGRALRNHLEHFDERLDVWALSSPHRNFVDMNIASAGAIVGIDSSDFQRNLDPDTLHFSFQDEHFDLHALALELKRVGEAAMRWLREKDPRRYNVY